MKAALTKRVSIVWFLLVCIAAAGAGVAWLAISREAAPRNAVLIEVANTRAPLIAGELAGSHSGDISAQPGITNTVVAPIPTQAGTLAVFVSGAVAKPGVYTLAVGSRVADAVAAAGGPTSQADLEATNLAARISDEEHISIPVVGAGPAPTAVITMATSSHIPAKATISQSPQKTGTATTQPVGATKININTATEADFETLPSIGPVLAQRIIADRDAHGPFATVDDLMRVPGIKDALLGKVRERVTIGP